MNFLVCPVPSQHIKTGYDHVNNDVSVLAVKSIKRSRVNHYFNETGFPAITFVGTDAVWVFPNLELREAMLEMLREGDERESLDRLEHRASQWLKKGLVAPTNSNGHEDWCALPVPKKDARV